jgi:hypothetical protein
VLGPPYKRATAGNDDTWVTQSLQRQVFADVLERDEVRVADAEVTLVMTGHRGSSGYGRPVTARVVATDRALHARLALGAGIYQMQRLDYGQVKKAGAAQPDERTLTITYWNPRTAADESWDLQVGAQAPSRFAATVLQLVSQRQAARRAAEEAGKAVRTAHTTAVRTGDPERTGALVAAANGHSATGATEAAQVAQAAQVDQAHDAGARAVPAHPSAGSEVA